MCKLGETETVVIGGKTQSIDRCIAPLVRALNESGIKTVASCCGHGRQPLRISIIDECELLIVPYGLANRIAKEFPPISSVRPSGRLRSFKVERDLAAHPSDLSSHDPA